MAKNNKPKAKKTKTIKAKTSIAVKIRDLFAGALNPSARRTNNRDTNSRETSARETSARETSSRETSSRESRARSTGAEGGYTAKHIEVLEGLEPVRRRPGMYIGGTDEKALHHLFAEVIDNAMDEALAGHATFIEVEVGGDGYLTVTDNGRGI